MWAALAGCSQQTDVALQTSVQAKYQHVWLTVSQVWFNTSATATPEDTSWNRFTLSTPITVDLATLSGGALAQIASGLKVPAGTYSQIRLIPVDPAAALTSSAQGAGAQFNAEADYTDSAGTAHQAMLELLNPDKGIGMSTTLTIKASLGALGAPSTSTCATGDNSCTPTGTTACEAGDANCLDSFGSPCSVGETGCTMTTATTTTTASSSSTPLSVALTLDGIHDLVQFAYGTQTGVLLNPHSSGLDVASAGAIRGSIDTTNIAGSIDVNGNIAAQVTAETLSADGTRHIAVKTVQVASDGSFVLYPLAAGSSSPTSYDLVIHGPQIATAIVKSVPVSAGDPSGSAAVSIGTVTPRSATGFTFNVATGTQALPAGALVNLYQTLPGSGEVPYVVDQVSIDPFSRVLLADEQVPTGTIDSGTYVSGGNVSLASSTPAQGASTYLIAGQASLFAAGTLATVLAPPSSGTGPVQVAIPALQPVTGAVSSGIVVTVIPALAGKYDHGELIVSHDGAIVQTVAIDSALTQNGGAALQVPGIPGGGSASSFDNAVYYVSTRAWNSRNPAGTLQRQSLTTPVDLSAGSVTGLTVNVD